MKYIQKIFVAIVSTILFCTFSLELYSQTIPTNGLIGSNLTLPKGTYNINRLLVVAIGATLTIEPGVTLMFSGEGGIVVEGNIIAIGNAAVGDSITFTSSTPNNLWGGLSVVTGTFKFCKFENGWLNFGNCTIENSQFAGNNAIHLNASTLNFSKLLISGDLNVNAASQLSNSMIEGGNNPQNPGSIGNAQILIGGGGIVKGNRIRNLNNNGIGIQNGLLVNNLIDDFKSSNVIYLSGGGDALIEGNQIIGKNNTEKDINGIRIEMFFGGNSIIRNNNIGGFKNNILIQGGNNSNSTTIQNNTFSGILNLGSEYNIRAVGSFGTPLGGTPTQIIATNNYWANVSPDNIGNTIFDRNNDVSIGGLVVYSPYLNSPDITSPVFRPRNAKKTLEGNQVKISWDANTETDIAGYKIYFGNFTGDIYSQTAFSNSLDVGNVTSYLLPQQIALNEDFAITAYDSSKDGVNDQIDGNESWYSPAYENPNQVNITNVNELETQIQINWDSVTNATNYNIYRSIDSTNFTLLSSTTLTSYIDQNLNSLQQRYFYRITAFRSLDATYTNSGLEGSSSLVVGAKPFNRATINAVASYTDSIKLTFGYNNNIQGINAINIYRSSNNEPRTLIKTLPKTDSSYIDKVINDKQYIYDATISNTTEESDPSYTKTASAFSIPVLTDRFHNKFDLSSADSLNWNKNALATKYQFQIDTSLSFSSSNLITVDQIDTFYFNQNLIKNTYLYWRVRAGDDNGYSSWSNYHQSQIAEITASIDSIISYTDQIKLIINKGNYLGVDSIYLYRSSTTQPREIISRFSANTNSYTDNVINGVYFTYEIAVKNQNDISKLSKSKTASAFSIPLLQSPLMNQLDIKPTHKFIFSRPLLSTKYDIEFDTVNTFNSSAYKSFLLSDTSQIVDNLIQNQNYYWRARGGDNNGFSSWSIIFNFQTYVKEASLDTIIAGNKTNTLKFTLPSDKYISKIYVLRDTLPNPISIIDSSTKVITEYVDKQSLLLNKKYYYALRLVNFDNIKSELSVIKSGTPFNTKPQAIKLNSKSFNNVGEFNTVRTTYSASGSKDPDGTITKYDWYVNDSLINNTDSILIYYYTQGTSNLKLVVTDNDGEKDSAQTTVTLKSFDKKFKGGILGGITALNSNSIFMADSTFDPSNGASIYKLDKFGNTIFSLVVSSKINTTPSISSDSSVFITSGTNLNGFNKAGAPLWSTIPLGGLSQVTPTIDSAFSRIYLGVSNKNFFAIDYKTGKIAWNIFCDAPITASAVISGDRKLVFVSESGTLYGFDIRSDSTLTVPKWKQQLGEFIAKSAAVDNDNNFYFGTNSGKLLKIKLNNNGAMEKIWTCNLNDPIESSPVIDSKGNIYIGTTKGKFHKIRATDGSIEWTYETSGSIKSTPAITEYGVIIFATNTGNVVALDAQKNVRWSHKEVSPITSNILYIENITYIGTEGGNLVAIFDNPNTNSVNTGLSRINPPKFASNSLANANSLLKSYFDLNVAKQKGLSSFALIEKTEKPIWGTFQGDYRRTGSMSYQCPSPAIINVPECRFGSDSIVISTNTMQNRFWILNNQIKESIRDSIIKISANDSYKIQSYNEIGCVVTSVEKKMINLGVINEKPSILTNSGFDRFCLGDTLQLSSNLSAHSYKWYFGDSPIANSNSKTFTTSISGAFSVSIFDSLGCKAQSDIRLIIETNPPQKPIISKKETELVSSNNLGNQWYLNDQKITGATTQNYKPIQNGHYSVKTILNGCESVMSDTYYFLTTAIDNLSIGEYFKITPNPISNNAFVSFKIQGINEAYLTIIDMSGKSIIENKKVTSGTYLKMETIPKGNYILIVREKTGKPIITQKIIKN